MTSKLRITAIGFSKMIEMMKFLDTYMWKIILFSLLFLVLLIYGCGMPDLPGPIGIPGI
jgi:hypothetical protein